MRSRLKGDLSLLRACLIILTVRTPQNAFASEARACLIIQALNSLHISNTTVLETCSFHPLLIVTDGVTQKKDSKVKIHVFDAEVIKRKLQGDFVTFNQYCKIDIIGINDFSIEPFIAAEAKALFPIMSNLYLFTPCRLY